MKNLTIKILIGIPASGKSTWAKKFLSNNPGWVCVNRDSYRHMLRNDNFCEPKIENMITEMMDNTIHKCLANKLNVIIDNTNVRIKYINHFIETFKSRADIEYQVFDISLSKAIERDKNRVGFESVGEEVIRKMYKDYLILKDSFDFQPIRKTGFKTFVPVEHNHDLPDCVIFDIDGTLALMNGKRGSFDWDKVFKDDINNIIKEQVDFHKSNGRYIILLSGRDEVSRKQTEDWLDLYGVPYDVLYMRKENDYRKDKIVKKEIYGNEIKGKYNVLAVYDDRLQVLDMWYDEGIYTFNVNQGNIPY